MGCMHCKKEFILKEGDIIKCPNCGKLPFKCWYCNEWISGTVNECKVCSPKFIICNHCGSCSEDCLLEEHTKHLQERFSIVSRKTAREIVEYFSQLNRGLVRKECPFKVSISYAKGLNKTMAIRLKGGKTKGVPDHSAFINRMQIIQDAPVGTEWTVDSIREDGSNGQEYREVFNILICLGHIQKLKRKSKTGMYFELWKRVENVECKYCNWNNLIEYKCPRCKKQLSKNQNCSCKYKRGIKKGESPVAKVYVTKIDFCNLPRKEFKEKGYIDEEKKGELS